MQNGESTNVVDRVRMTFESTDFQPRRQHGTRRPRKDYRETERVRRETEGAEKVRREYGQSGHSTDVLFKYGHSTDVCDVQADLQSPYLKCDDFYNGNSFAFIQT